MTSGVYLLFSIGILGGIFSSILLKKAHAPRVLGYIIAGLIIGQSGFKIVTISDIDNLEVFNIFALAIIGFLVGAEIRISDMRRYGKQFLLILFGEGLGAFFSVSLLTGGVLYFSCGSLSIAIAGGIVFGAIASATDPASTMSVLWESRSAGVFTTTLIAIIALDDALAMFLYGLSSGIAQVLAGSDTISLRHEFITVAINLVGSLGLGSFIGFLTSHIILKFHRNEQVLSASFGIFLLAIALSISAGLDVIIVSMMAGLIISNRTPIRSKFFIEYMNGIASPVYVIFFVLIGSRLSLTTMPGWLWLLVVLFVLGRSLGKVVGAYLGAKASNASNKVQRYIGLGLFSQGGVAIGLSIIAGHHLDSIQLIDGLSLGDVIISTITTTTFLIQIIGPATVKIATKLSGEEGLDINMEDLIKELTVKKVLPSTTPVIFHENTTIAKAINMFSEVDASLIPVITEDNKLVGIISFENFRNMLTESSLWAWSLVTDIMSYDVVTVSLDTPLERALTLAHSINYPQIPVIENGKLKGMLDIKTIENSLKIELIKKKEQSNGT